MAQKRTINRNKQQQIDELQKYINEHPQANIQNILDQQEVVDLSGSPLKTFIAFVTQNSETFLQMLYLIDADETELNEQQLKRYPFLVSELFKNDQIVDFIFTSPDCKEILDTLFNVLEADSLNTTVAGYFAKIINYIMKKKGLDLWNYLNQFGGNIFSDFVKHLYNQNIAFALKDLILLNTYVQENQNTFLSERSSLAERIFQYMVDSKYNEFIVENISTIFSELLNEIFQYDEKSQFLGCICKAQQFYQLISHTQSTSVVKLLNLVMDSIQWYIIKTKEKNPDFVFNFDDFQVLGVNFLILLQRSPSIQSFQPTYSSGQEQPFGQYRLQLLEFYYKVLQTQDQSLLQFFDHQSIYNLIMQFIEQHQFNNALQNIFVNITIFIFSSNIGNVQQAYYNAQLFEFLKCFGQINKGQVGSISKQITRGYSGAVNKLIYFFRQYNDQSWVYFLSLHQEILDAENKFLFNINPHEGEDNSLEESNCNLAIISQNIMELIQTDDQNIQLSATDFGQITGIAGESQELVASMIIEDENQNTVDQEEENSQVETQQKKYRKEYHHQSCFKTPPKKEDEIQNPMTQSADLNLPINNNKKNLLGSNTTATSEEAVEIIQRVAMVQNHKTWSYQMDIILENKVNQIWKSKQGAPQRKESQDFSQNFQSNTQEQKEQEDDGKRKPSTISYTRSKPQ